MPKHLHVPDGQIMPAGMFDALQEFVGRGSPNFRVDPLNATTLRGLAGVGSDQAGIAIGGLWRWRTSSFDLALSGAAGLYDVFAVCSANEIAGTTTDTTDYNWYLVALPQGTTPTGNTPAGRPIAAYRRVAYLSWSGSAINDIVYDTLRVGVEPAYYGWKDVAHRWGTLSNIITGTRVLAVNARRGAQPSTGSQASPFPDQIPLDPSAYQAGGRLLRYRIRLWADNNNVNAATAITVWLQQWSGFTGGTSGNANSGIAYSASGTVLGSVAIASLAAPGTAEATSAEFDLSGSTVPNGLSYYGLLASASGLTTTGASLRLFARLQVHQRKF